MQEMQAVVLAGTHERARNTAGKLVPRPLLDLDAEPLLTVHVRRLSMLSGLSRITVVTNEAVRPELQDWAAGLAAGLVPVRVLGDGTTLPAERRGAVGDWLYAVEQGGIDDDIVVVAADNWLADTPSALVTRSWQRSPAVVVTH